jgi:hypothetical protein
MQACFTALIFLIGAVDVCLSHQFSLAPLALLYAGLRLQADSAAAKFLQNGLTLPLPFLEPQKAARRKPDVRLLLLEEPEKKRQTPPQPRAAAPTGRKPGAPKPPREKPPFHRPRFSGIPHEVLGVEQDAVTSRIVLAFRHWIKEYHPDHRPEMRQSATEKARQLTEARDALLKKRKQMHKPGAA